MIEVRHGKGSYPVRFVTWPEVVAALPSQAFVVTDSNVRAAWGESFGAAWRVLELEPGEGSKSVAILERIWEWLADNGCERGETLTAIGGGVVGDVVGFAAATYMRGIRLIQVPTSLLAQVDSSVGGKVGIDLRAGKNLAGAFWPPFEVLIACETLRTLPEREFLNGLAEVLKYGFIADPSLLDLGGGLNASSDADAIADVVARCVRLKADIVARDEMDTSGIRATLNFGHTIGHALEALAGYGPLLHGEAVSVGMAVESRIGELLGVTPRGTADSVERALRASGLPTTHPLLKRIEDLLNMMLLDKKAAGGRPAMALLTRIGACKLVPDVPRETIAAALTAP